MKESASARLLVRAEHAVSGEEAFVFVEAVPWRTGADDPALRDATVPGAHLAHVRDAFAGPPSERGGHLPLPPPKALRHVAAQWRQGRESATIVLFTRHQQDLPSATRAWFALSWAGVARVRILLGGLSAWRAAGGALGAAAPPLDPAAPVLAQKKSRSEDVWPVRVLDADELARAAQMGTVLDARPEAHYSGFTDDPRSGHVPGAISAPASTMLDAEGSLLPPRLLRRWFLEHGALGSHRVAAYCHGGVSSSLLVFGGAMLGQSIGLYVGSWSAWSQNPRLPVAVGSDHGPSPSDRFTCFDQR